MPAERTSERLKRILVMVPWVMARPGATVSEVCERFAIGEEELIADLETLFVCGLPPFGPGDLIYAAIDGDEVVIEMAGYLARPPRLTRGEAIALLVTGRAVAELPGLEGTEHLRSALEKLRTAIAPQEAETAADVAERINVEVDAPGLLGEIAGAIGDRARLSVAYYSAGRAEMTERILDPLVVRAELGNWYLVAFDHRSGEVRLFRVDRLRELRRTGETFEPPELEEAPELATPSPEGREVLIEAEPRAAWLREAVRPLDEEQRPDGGVRVRLRTAEHAWLVRLLLAAGGAARALEPADLRAETAAAARRALARYDAVGSDR